MVRKVATWRVKVCFIYIIKFLCIFTENFNPETVLFFYNLQSTRSSSDLMLVRILFCRCLICFPSLYSSKWHPIKNLFVKNFTPFYRDTPKSSKFEFFSFLNYIFDITSIKSMESMECMYEKVSRYITACPITLLRFALPYVTFCGTYRNIM